MPHSNYAETIGDMSRGATATSRFGNSRRTTTPRRTLAKVIVTLAFAAPLGVGTALGLVSSANASINPPATSFTKNPDPCLVYHPANVCPRP